MTELSDSHKGWDTNEHLDFFDGWNQRNYYDFSEHYGCFEENRYLIRTINKLYSKSNFFPSVLDIGCATGTTYRYLKQNFKKKDINYLGVDISHTAIDKATSLHGRNLFKAVEENWTSEGQSADIVYSRDTVMHQADPLSYLHSLIKLSKKHLILRLRTRDTGATVFDIEHSCQAHYSKFWMPYIVLNIDELSEFLKNNEHVQSAIINRSYNILGGGNLRNLPKELFFADAGGSETSLLINMSNESCNGANIDYTFTKEGHDFIKSDLFKFRLLRLTSKITNIISN